MYRAVVAFFLLLSVQASGQEEPNFYAGRTVSILVGSGAGGLTDTSARLIARFLERHISGGPRVIVQNMPGGGGLIGEVKLEQVGHQSASSVCFTASSRASVGSQPAERRT